MARSILPFPQELRPQLPTIVGNVDYARLREQLQQIDVLLHDSGVEQDFVQRALDRWRVGAVRGPSALEQLKYQQRSRRALRCTILRTLLQEDTRGFSCQLAGNPLYQWFCQIDAVDQIRVPSKSEVQRFAHWLPAEQMRQVLDGVLKNAAQKPETMGLEEALDLETYFVDSTCLKANIHFPTDWVLLRDAVRTLMKATVLIRGEGLRGRMKSPETFLRAMKKLVGVVRKHAQRHRELLDRGWQQTRWTRPQTEQILRRIDGVVKQLPEAQKQAHERIIGGRKVDNEKKILSLYESEVRVIVRGKAGAEVEFGNTVLLGENSQGILLDYEIFRESAPADSQILFGSLTRVLDVFGQQVEAVVGDRGFQSAANSRALEEAGTFDGLCPRKPATLHQRMKEPKFAELQRRRGQTEGRIGIFKNGFLGRPMRAKGFEHRALALAWAVLTHNLWKFAQMRKAKKKSARLPRAA